LQLAQNDRFLKRRRIMPEATDAPTDPRYVFVYGTLRRGESNDITRLAPAPSFVGESGIAGTMYQLGRYPGVTLGGSGRVAGEVYAITAELERVLDEIEELYPQQSDEYFKRIVPVEVAGRWLDCIVYEINPRYVVAARPIVGGDWAKAGRS
jgi:gamma-glutamylcyclotransferase (GGCT)/AIG2-like uncharacterized protein YtfP